MATMKIRHFKRRAKRPDFRMTRIFGTMVIELKSATAAARFFGPTEEENERAREFFGDGAQREAG
jgi:hypothetical protein